MICSNWETWTDDFNELHIAGYSLLYPRWCRPQAVLSDIEFDLDGSMILAFMDRTGHQTGYLQYDVANTVRGNGYVGGDILRVHNNKGTFELENAGTTSAGGGCGANGQGPGGGEYYCGEALVGFHEETSLGALALSVSDSLVALNVMDPTTIFTGGTAWLDNNTGDTTGVIELYNSGTSGGAPDIGTFGKAAGLGDLELVCEPAPIEIGNYVWADLNANGIQGPSEKGIDGITVELVKNNAVVATTVTANGGQYYFSKDGATNQTWTTSGAKVLPNMGYTIRIATNQFSGKGIKLVKPNMPSDVNTYLRDNDGTVNGNYAEVSFTTGRSGCMAHEYDFGIAPTLCLGNLVWEDLNNNGLKDKTEKGLSNMEVILYTPGADGIKGNADDVEMSRDTTDMAGNYLFTGLCGGDYYVKLNAGSDMHSSTGEGPEGIATRTFEPAADPDNDIDNQDDGTQMGTMVMSGLITLALDSEPTNDADLDSNSNTTVDFGLFKLLSLGNKVWNDRNNNGLFDTNEKGVNNVEVILYEPGTDGKRNTADDVEVARKRTNINGCYMFDNLFPGEYWVKLNGTPQGFVSSDGNGHQYTGTGVYEPGASPEINNDADDNGAQMGTMVISEMVKLVLYEEPMDDADAFNFTNTTVDFALFPKNQIMLFDPCNCLGNESSPGAGDGQFSDRIIILSSISGETWTLKSANGLYSPNSPAPPSAPSPIALGTKAQEEGMENGFFKYVMDVRHIDGTGYSACFTNGTDILNVANNCESDKDCNFNIVAGPNSTPTPKLDPCAQNFILGVNGIPKIDTLKCCDDKSTFADDGSKDGLYLDTTARTDVYTICAQNQWQYLQFNFAEFGLSEGDTLYVYDGKDNTAPLIGKFSGAGVSQTGGWVSSNCDPAINASACLTFELKTNGDNRKDIGWNGKFECKERDIQLSPPNDLSAKLACEELYKTFTIQPAVVKTACGTVQDTQFIRIYDAQGKLCKDTCLGGTETMDEAFAIGQYRIEYKLKKDTIKTTEAIITVQGATLVCNDIVNIPLGDACAIMIEPDMLLEALCDTITDSLYYFITLKGLDKKGDEKIIASGGGKGGNYPMVMASMIDICSSSLTAEIEKRYYDDLNLHFCNNGVQKVSCAIQINISDQSAPWFTNITRDTFKVCHIDLTEKGLGLSPPKAVDNCDSVAVSFLEAKLVDDGKVCDTSRAEVTWEAVDLCGNVSTVTQPVVFIRSTMEDIVKAPNTLLSCEKDTKTTFSDFETTGIPGIKIGKIKNGILIPSDTIPLNTDTYVCGYILQKRDIELEGDCGVKLFRYWDILDWCSPNNGPLRLDTQLVELRDITPPAFVLNEIPATDIALDHHSCTYDITKLAGPAATDNCSIPTVRLDQVSRIEDGEKWEIDYTDLECDSFCLRWVAEDICHEQRVNDTIYQIVIIKDLTKPGAVCVDQLHVSIGNEATKIHYTDINAGSSDACGIDKYEVSRDENDWAEEVFINCEDVHRNIKVYLRVTDAKGNQNTCWTIIIPEDKIAPICSDLPAASQTCNKDHTDNYGSSTDRNENGHMDAAEWTDMTTEQATFYNKKFGDPICSDNLSCGALNLQQQYQLISWPCGMINIKRRFRAIDWDNEGNVSNWAEQKITVEYKANWKVIIPADWAGDCAEEIPTSDVQIFNGTCDLMASEMDEQIFVTQEDACLKIVRTFTLINWCKYDVNKPAVTILRNEDNHGFATHEQIIHASDSVNGVPLAEIGKIKYVQVLKIRDSKAPLVTIEEPDGCLNESCRELKTWTASAEDCSPKEGFIWTGRLYEEGVLVAEVSSNILSYNVKAKDHYKAEFWVSDGCGNSGGAETPGRFFWDCKKPTPYCLHGVATSLMPGGMVQVWATDLNQGSSDNCAPKSKLRFRIWHNSLGAAPTSLPEVLDLPENITFTCAYLGYQDVNIYVIDEEDNWDYCETYVLIQDNTKACENTEMPAGMASISGIIADWNGNPVESVQTEVSNSASSLGAMMTKEDGRYDFELTMYQDYVIYPEKDIHPLNGVSTYDLVLMTKHILGLSSFDSPYQWIAADINQSGTITTYDLVQLRKLILAIDENFQNNTSWRFVEAAYPFTTDNPLSENFPKAGQVSNLSHNMKMDFVAVKIGDVNGNAQANRFVNSEVRSTPQVFEINVEDMDTKAGATYTVTFSTHQLDKIQGYQFTLAYQDLKLENLTSQLIGIEHFGLHKLNENYITTSWNHSTSQQLNSPPSEMDKTQSLFSIKFEALHSDKLSRQLALLDRPTPIEAYDKDGNIMEVRLKFEAQNQRKTFELYQNQPNPFDRSTNIDFYLPEDSEVVLSLKDEMGRLLKEIKEDRRAGKQRFQLNDLEQLPKGIIYYQISTKFGTKVSKMLRLD